MRNLILKFCVAYWRREQNKALATLSVSQDRLSKLEGHPEFRGRAISAVNSLTFAIVECEKALGLSVGASDTDEGETRWRI